MTRLKNLMKRAANGESLVIGFLGGSITQGSLSSTPKTCYAYLVYEWWKKSFPNAAFSFVNGGIGGTTSHYGGARAWKDVLCYRPDIVTVDFSVNDDANEFFEETYEGMLRRLLAAPSDPAVVVLNNVFYDIGKNAQNYHNRIADHYGIPHVSIKDTVYPDVESGKIVRADITPDNLHPNDKGHRLVADEICKLLDSIKAEMEEETIAGENIEFRITKLFWMAFWLIQLRKKECLIFLKMDGQQRIQMIKLVLRSNAAVWLFSTVNRYSSRYQRPRQ